MKAEFSAKRITNIVATVPSRVCRFEDDMRHYDFSEAKSRRLAATMGFDEHRIAPEGMTSSDLCEFGFRHLVSRGLDPLSVDALIFVSHTPDHVLPPTSSILHGKLGLREDCYCVDINHGCAGYIVALHQAAMLLETSGCKRVVVFAGDTLSKHVNKRDRNSYPVVGDAGSVSIIENSETGMHWKFDIRNRGSDAQALIIPAGGSRLPRSSATSIVQDQGDGNHRSLDELTMQGTSVFAFVQAEIPVLVQSLLDDAQLNRDDIDKYIFHQPNRFMLEKLADKIAVPRDKVPNNIVEKYGNSNSATIPLTLVHNLGSTQASESTLKLLLSGFGVGLTWGGVIIDFDVPYMKLLEMNLEG